MQILGLPSAHFLSTNRSSHNNAAIIMINEVVDMRCSSWDSNSSSPISATRRFPTKQFFARFLELETVRLNVWSKFRGAAAAPDLWQRRASRGRKKMGAMRSKCKSGGDHEETQGGPVTESCPSFPGDMGEVLSSLSCWKQKRRILEIGFVGLLATAAWFRNLGAAGLMDDTEPLFVEAARQMLLTGDYITPQFNAQPRFDKPILVYWLMALSAKLFGLSVWVFRLPSALCALGLLLSLLLTVKRFGLNFPTDLQSQSQETQTGTSKSFYIPAIITAGAFALNLEVVVWGSTALSDMLLTSTIGATLLTFFWGYATHVKWGYPMSAVFMGLACLSKGPIGIVFPVCVCALFLLCRGELSNMLLEELPYLEGTLAILLINLPWYGFMVSKHGLLYLSTFFGYHNLERFVRGVNHHWGRPWWYGIAVVVVMYLPWSLSLPPALVQANPWNPTWRKAERWQTLPLFAATWFAAGFGIFALSSTQAAQIGNLLCEKQLHEIAVVIFVVAGGLAMSTAEFRAFLGSQPQTHPSTKDKQSSQQRRLLPLWVLHTAAMLAFLIIFITPVYQAADTVRQAPLRELASLASQVQKAGEPLLMVGTRMPSVVFYSKLPTAFFDSWQEASTVLQQQAPRIRSALIISERLKEESSPSKETIAVAGDHMLIRVLNDVPDSQVA
ncbi:hypothetical protein BDL97_04G074900 [Sphagnum fallax]|nr:hypothetical protein BDL97_04G074900 [Sphagnum fallax]KAH8964579.1 hypothetical protein BDL97_04G074900 [Sphagnum fallax]